MTFAETLLLLALLCLLAAAVADVTRFEIPDTLSIALIALAVGFGFTQPDFPWLLHGGALLLMFGIGALLFSRGWMGGGDVKVLTGTAAWVGLQGLLLQLAAVAIAGGVLALVLILARAGGAAINIPAERLPRVFQPGAPLPYAVAIAAGTIWWAWQSWPLA